MTRVCVTGVVFTQLSIEPDSPHVLLSCGEDGTVLQIDLREPEDERNK